MVDPVQVRSLAVNLNNSGMTAEGEISHAIAAEPVQTVILSWFNRIAQFMKNSIAVAKGRQ